jgi:hypothetical protein
MLHVYGFPIITKKKKVLISLLVEFNSYTHLGAIGPIFKETKSTNLYFGGTIFLSNQFASLQHSSIIQN